MRRRGFEIVNDKFLEDVIKEDIFLPKRATHNSAGYDFFLPRNINIKPKESISIKTYIKAYMENDEVLLIFIRISIGVKKNLVLKNITGVIDSDYYNNKDNDGNIIINLINNGNEEVSLLQHERFVQGIFVKYLKVDDEEFPKKKRLCGFGSTV